MSQLGPIQFNIDQLWLHSRRELMADEAVLRAITKIQDRWMEVAQFKYEEESPHDEEMAREEFELDVHIGKVKVKDLHWLRKQFESHVLADLALAIAQAVMPEKNWEIIDGQDYEVVADVERSTVFDMKNGRDLSAGASLLIACDPKYQPNQAVREEVAAWTHERATRCSELVDKMQNHLNKFNKPGEVVSLT